MEHDLHKDVNMKLIFYIFEQLLGLKINSHRSDFFFDKENNIEDQYENMGCEVISLPFRYLGVPIHRRKLLNKE